MRLHRVRSLALVLVTAAGSLRAQTPTDAPPPVAREFRAVWVATVANIDWPSRSGLSSWAQQAELRAIMDRAVALKLNALVFQVRPAADALYDSPYEPWSEYLTGTQGLPPDPYYDPLAFAVKEAHARGLELHAWFNPYRAKHPTAKSPIAPGHVSRTRPALVRTYGTHLWLDPGLDAVRKYSLDVVTDVVRRYDVDAVHIDDYFYPYKERDSSRKVIPFPDDSSYAIYQKKGGTLERDDWRRDNVNRFVQEMYGAVHRVKPWVQVGVSPFGMWRPGFPAQIKGFDAYAELYADARLWWRNGWVDYLAPQLYWTIAQPAQSFPVLLRWWAEENVKGRHLWPGLFTSRVGAGGATTWPAAEIPAQIRIARADSGASGHIHFSEKGLRASTGPAADSLAARRDSMVAELAALYAEPALVPRTPWLDATPPAAPRVALARLAASGALVLQLRPAVASDVRMWVIQTRDAAGTWTTQLRPAAEREVVLAAPGAAVPARVVVRAVDRMGNESRAVEAR